MLREGRRVRRRIGEDLDLLRCCSISGAGKRQRLRIDSADAGCRQSTAGELHRASQTEVRSDDEAA